MCYALADNGALTAYLAVMTDHVTDNATLARYELTIDGKIVFATYRREDGKDYIRHVEAPHSLRGSGAAGRLMQGIVDIVRADGRKIVPLCSYAAAWMRRHRDSLDLMG